MLELMAVALSPEVVRHSGAARRLCTYLGNRWQVGASASAHGPIAIPKISLPLLRCFIIGLHLSLPKPKQSLEIEISPSVYLRNSKTLLSCSR